MYLSVLTDHLQITETVGLPPRPLYYRLVSQYTIVAVHYYTLTGMSFSTKFFRPLKGSKTMHSRMNKEYKQAAFTLHTGNQYLKSICVEFDPGSYVVNMP